MKKLYKSYYQSVKKNLISSAMSVGHGGLGIALVKTSIAGMLGIDVDLKKLADMTHGFVGADLSALTKEAAMVVLRKLFPEIKLKEDEPISKEVRIQEPGYRK